MEQITEFLNQTLLSQPISTESEKHRSLSTATQPKLNLQKVRVSAEKLAAMLSALNKRWLSMGWRVMSPADSEAMALIWIESLDREHVPPKHYEELYHRSIRLRATRYELGLKCDDFSVEMMLGCWPALAQEIRQKEIDAKRYLPQTAASDCDRCYGSGMECTPKGARQCPCRNRGDV